jgi:two-component system, OmpR family, response regulator
MNTINTLSVQQASAGPVHVVALDDDAEVRDMVSGYLANYNLRVTAVASGHELDETLEREAVDLLLLDLNLDGEDGMQIAKRLRETTAMPILMLSGRGDEIDRVLGLELGADDYLTKPFSPRELLARVRALLRRVAVQSTVADAIARVRIYRFGTWEVNIGLRKLRSLPTGQRVDLTRGEFSLLAALLSAPGRVLTRDDLLDLSRLHNAEVYDRSIDVQILRLRRKIEPDPAHPTYIRTERGVGYLLDAEVKVLR